MSDTSDTSDTSGQQPAETPQPATQGEEILRIPQGKFQERLDRHHRLALREQFGTDDPEVIRAAMQTAQQAAEAEETRRREAMTREQQLQADLDAARREAEEAREAADGAQFDRLVAESCAKIGVRDVDYARYRLAEHLQTLPADAQVDPDEWLAQQAAAKPGAYGYAPTPEAVPVPVTTDPAAANGTQEPAPPAPGQAPRQLDDLQLDDHAWAARKQALGLIQ